MKDLLTFGMFMKKKRLELGMKQAEVSRGVGFRHRSSYHRLEWGHIEWSIEDLVKVCMFMGLNPGDTLSEYLGLVESDIKEHSDKMFKN